MPQWCKNASATSPLYYGWYVVGVAFLAHFVSIGSTLYAMNAFMEPLCRANGWSRTDVSLALVWGSLFGFLGQFVYGSLVSRLQIRRLMLGGALVAGGIFMLLTRTSVLWQFYLLYIVLYLANGAYGGIVANTAVNNWFSRNRGRALGIATAGISLSGVILPMAAMLLILRWGMHRAAVVMGMGIGAVGVLAWRVVRNWPEACGLHPDGAAVEEVVAATSDAAGGRETSAAGMGTVSSIVKLPEFWRTGIAFAMIMIGAMGVMSQLKPRFVDIGFDDVTAMTMMSATALVATAGKYVWGMWCDRFDPGRVAVVLAAANGVGLLPALLGNTLPWVILFIVCFGFAMGGTMAVYPILVADRFGRRLFPRVYRLLVLFMILQMAGFLIAGQSFDRTGSYDAGYGLFILFDMIAAGLLLGMSSPMRRLRGCRPASQ